MNLKAQTKWRWNVAVYLFLAGLGSGAYITGVFADFMGAGWTRLASIGVALGFPCVFAATVIKVSDLGTPRNAWRAGMRPGTSWMARGTLILTAFMVVGAIHIAFWVWPFAGVLRDATALRHAIGVVGGVLACGTMFYTGILLAAAKPIAFWSTAMLPLLFLVSALLTGMMSVVLVALMAGMAFTGAVAHLQQIVAILIILQSLVLAFYLQSTHRVPESRASARLVLTGTLAPLFWIGVGVLSVGIPLFLGFLDLFDIYGGGTGTFAFIACLSGVIGSLLLRQVVLAGGIHAPLRAGRFEVALPIV